MQCFLIISPVLLAIVEYICLGKMVAMSKTGRDSRIMRWQSRVFALSDVVCLCIQGSAGAMLSSKDPDTSLRGRRLMLIGLAAHLGSFTCFTCLCAYVQRSPQYGLEHLSPARHVFGTLYATIAFMFGRNIFRVAEFTQGFHGSLASNEVYFYVFDFTLIFGCFLLFAVQHFGVYLPRVQEAILEMQQVAAGTQGGGGAPLTDGGVTASKGTPLAEIQEKRLGVVVGTGTDTWTGTRTPQKEYLVKKWPQQCW
ncbi:hypothetical protein VaNZ11_016093 [Volvox africanus]|uniref:Uncharacterized protein n=1 Tax=Volvox africanus TaxID=51714 RepID=A0ABQ5SPD9_9CHLO|nr:hypothetical protein VaNZ11_016093 [Volvox africanus]